MTGPRIAVTIPVGPRAHHRDHLPEALASAMAQTYPLSEILIVDDMAGLPLGPLAYERGTNVVAEAARSFVDYGRWPPRVPLIWRAPWRLGVPAAFNAGVALADADFVIMLGADDTLEPDAAELTANMIGQLGAQAEHAYLYYGVRYMDTGEEQTAPCNAACVSKALWRRTGGFAPETAVGACDTMFITLLMHRPDLGGLHYVDPTRPLYNYRRSATTDTAGRSAAWQGPIFAVRDMLAREWTAPEWGRYE